MKIEAVENLNRLLNKFYYHFYEHQLGQHGTEDVYSAVK